jgi:hypothetical protein
MARSQTQQDRERRIRRRDQLAVLVKIMSEPVGREWFYDLLSSCHVYTSSFGHNALAMAFREGERNVGIRIGSDITEASPDLYLQMLKEAAHVRSRATAQRTNGANTDDTADDSAGSADIAADA